MVSKTQLIDEILELVDASPLTEVEIAPLLLKYIDGLDFDKEQKVRCDFDSVLSDLSRIKDIRYRGCNLTASSGRKFLSHNCLIASTMERVEKLKQIERDSINKGTKNIHHIETNSGIAIQGSTLSEIDFRPSIYPPTEQKTEADRHGQNTSGGKLITKRIVEIIIMVIGGLIVAYLIFKFGWNK